MAAMRSGKRKDISVTAETFAAAKKFVDGKPEFRSVQVGGHATYSVSKLVEKLIVSALDAAEGSS